MSKEKFGKLDRIKSDVGNIINLEVANSEGQYLLFATGVIFGLTLFLHFIADVHDLQSKYVCRHNFVKIRSSLVSFLLQNSNEIQ
jgi:hypothetical protein